MSTFVDEAPAPSAELRTTLALASMSVALIQVMNAVHGLTAVPFAAGLAGLSGVAALALAFTRARGVLFPIAALNVPISLMWFVTRPGGLGGFVGALAGLAIAGGAIALARDADDVVCKRWSRVAFVMFACAALTGFGHLGH